MAGHKQHDFHLVDPSPWPFIAAMGALTMLTGAIFWMNGTDNTSSWLFWVGLAIIFYVAYAWWADVVKEAHGGDHTPVVRIGLRYGVILFIISEVMFFVAWFWMYFKHALIPMPATTGDVEALGGNHGGVGVWPPTGVELVDPWHLPLLNTLILLTSGAAATWAHHAIMENDRKGLVNGLVLAIVLGVLFTAIQAYEYYEIFEYGWFVNETDPSVGWIYGSSFIMATGFHGFHVLIGTLFLGVCLIRALKGHFAPEGHVGFEAAAWYWHFVDVVWLFLFAGIYVGAVWGL
ncbi:MAG: cytochrome c oxidase subunit 3 [Pseudomonadota bacterium]